MDILMIFFTALISFIISPGIFFTFPKSQSKWVIALTHAVIFAVLYEMVEKTLEQITRRLESYTDYSTSTFAGQRRNFPDSPIIKNGEVCMSNTCVCNGDQIAFYDRCQ